MHTRRNHVVVLTMLVLLPFFQGCDCDGAKQKATEKVESAKAKAVERVQNVVKPLAEEDIEQYIQAYRNFSRISAQLEAERKKSGAVMIFTSKECRALLGKAVRGAGYADFKSFLLMDYRMHYTLRGVAYLRIANIVGATAEGITADVAREKLKGKKDLAQEERDRARELLDTVTALDRHIAALASFVKQASEKLLRQADLEIVDKHFDRILGALTDPQLPPGLRHSTDVDWDD